MTQKLCVVGSKNGSTIEALRVATVYIRGCTELHHRDCVGTDTQIHNIAHTLRKPVVTHPSTVPYSRAYSEYYDTRVACDPVNRDRGLVEECDTFIVLHSSTTVTNTSNTYKFIQMVNVYGKSATVIYNNGSTQIFKPGHTDQPTPVELSK